MTNESTSGGNGVMPQLVPAFRTLFHADWSVSPRKRWVARANLADGRWTVHAPCCAPRSPALVDLLFASSLYGPVLAGFDFPIGLPAAFGKRSGAPDFPSALAQFGTGRWQRFYEAAETADEISIARPFYPRRSRAGRRRAHLLAGHGVASWDDLLRTCEHATDQRRAACSLFWTLGGNQVGKAAITGWREIVRPALSRGAKVWPFDGDLRRGAVGGSVVIAETYPAEAYGHVGVAFGTGESKRRQGDRARRAKPIEHWAKLHDVDLSAPLQRVLRDGFGPSTHGEDPFDALLGLLGMIEVVAGRRPEGAPDHADVPLWEGWILGQRAS